MPYALLAPPKRWADRFRFERGWPATRIKRLSRRRCLRSRGGLSLCFRLRGQFGRRTGIFGDPRRRITWQMAGFAGLVGLGDPSGRTRRPSSQYFTLSFKRIAVPPASSGPGSMAKLTTMAKSYRSGVENHCCGAGRGLLRATCRRYNASWVRTGRPAQGR